MLIVLPEKHVVHAPSNRSQTRVLSPAHPILCHHRASIEVEKVGSQQSEPIHLFGLFPWDALSLKISLIGLAKIREQVLLNFAALIFDREIARTPFCPPAFNFALNLATIGERPIPSLRFSHHDPQSRDDHN